MNTPRLPLALRMRRLHRRLQHAAARRFRRPRTTYVQERVDEYRSYWSAAAERIGADFLPLSGALWEVRRNGGRVRVSNYVVSADDPVTLRMAGDKALCYRLASEAGVPVPVHGVFTLDRLEEARDFVTTHGFDYDWSVKPVSGTASGHGVSTYLRDWRALRGAALLASLYGLEFLVERTVPAESCRLLFLGGELVHAVRRRGARVVGDGLSTVRELAIGKGFPLDECTAATLGHAGRTLFDVPAAGEGVVVRAVPATATSLVELRTVYDETITAEVGPALLDEARRIVAALGSEFAGVDVLTNDPTVGLEESGGVFLEINTTPGIHHHYQSAEDRTDHPVAARVLEYLLERPAVISQRALAYEP